MNAILFVMLAQAGEVAAEVALVANEVPAGGLEVPAALMAIVPVLAIILQIIKQVPAIGKFRAYFPILAAVLGALAGLVLLPDEPILVRIVGGVAAGLASSGGFSTVKSLVSVVKPSLG